MIPVIMRHVQYSVSAALSESQSDASANCFHFCNCLVSNYNLPEPRDFYLQTSWVEPSMNVSSITSIA